MGIARRLRRGKRAPARDLAARGPTRRGPQDANGVQVVGLVDIDDVVMAGEAECATTGFDCIPSEIEAVATRSGRVGLRRARVAFIIEIVGEARAQSSLGLCDIGQRRERIGPRRERSYQERQ